MVRTPLARSALGASPRSNASRRECIVRRAVTQNVWKRSFDSPRWAAAAIRSWTACGEFGRQWIEPVGQQRLEPGLDLEALHDLCRELVAGRRDDRRVGGHGGNGADEAVGIENGRVGPTGQQGGDDQQAGNRRQQPSDQVVPPSSHSPSTIPLQNSAAPAPQHRSRRHDRAMAPAGVLGRVPLPSQRDAHDVTCMHAFPMTAGAIASWPSRLILRASS